MVLYSSVVRQRLVFWWDPTTGGGEREEVLHVFMCSLCKRVTATEFSSSCFWQTKFHSKIKEFLFTSRQCAVKRTTALTGDKLNLRKITTLPFVSSPETVCLLVFMCLCSICLRNKHGSRYLGRVGAQHSERDDSDTSDTKPGQNNVSGSAAMNKLHVTFKGEMRRM